jgi:hypothetical protein
VLKKMMKTLAESLTVFIFLMASDASAMTLDDVLECGLPDGSKFILRSQYDWSPVPLPMVHSSRETNRGGWVPSYQDKSGKVVPVPFTIPYSGNSKPVEACAYFGMKNGAPLAPFSFRRADGSWFLAKDFPRGALDIHVDRVDDASPLRQELQRAGIKSEAYRFGWLYQDGGEVIYEKPLHRTDTGYVYSIPIDAVFQARSSDGGGKWSEGHVTADARIFELGRGWIEQSIRARPVSLNGKSIP